MQVAREMRKAAIVRIAGNHDGEHTDILYSKASIADAHEDARMKIEILDHNFSRMDATLPWLNEYVSYMFEMYNYRSKKWKRERVFLIDAYGSFLTGLVPYITEELARKRISIEIDDNRKFPKIDYKIPDITVDLRPYQIEYLAKALREKRMIVDSVTGSGKTVMMASILDTLGLATLIIAPNATVQTQLKIELMKLLPHKTFGIVGGGVKDLATVTIGLSRSLVKLEDEELRTFKLLLVDDAHCAAANQIADVILRMEAPYRFGFTGTSTGRSDNKDLVVHGLLGQPIRLIEPQELVEAGYIADVQASMYYGNWQGNYNHLENLLIVHNPVRNELIKKIVSNNRNRTILILVRRLDHGEILKSMFRGSVFVSGELSTEQREEIRQDVQAGRVKILIASGVYATGLDIPNLDIGINAAGGKGEILTKQKIGRLMRPWHNLCKKWFDIFDYYHPTLEEHSKERFRIYKESNVNIELIGFPPGKKKRLEEQE